MWRSIRLVVYGLIFLFLQNSSFFAQTSSTQKPKTAATEEAAVSAKPTQPTNTASAVSDVDPVITIQGVCGQASSQSRKGSGSCSTVITRKEFEKLMNALDPGGEPISSLGRQNLAQAYVEALAFVQAAHKSGMDESAQTQEVLYWARLRTISELYRRNLQEEYRTPSAEEIEAYYQQHLKSFETVHLLRILAPRESPREDKAEFDKKALAAMQTALTRARNGEPLEAIQKDVYSSIGLERPPGTDLGTFRRSDFMAKEAEEVFSLQPGEASQLETEVKSYVIYKIASKSTLTLAQAKAEIVQEISQQKYRDALKAVMDSAHADFNEQYFGPMAPKPALEPPAMPRSH